VDAPQQVQINVPDLLNLYHQYYYHVGAQFQGTFRNTYWMGVRVEKLPSDLWMYQELLVRIRPRVIIETGTLNGGSALFLCHMCDILGVGHVITIDLRLPAMPPRHPRLTYLTGSSVDPAIVAQAQSLAQGQSPVMVIFDSAHTTDHVLAEMRAYHPLVTPGSYMIVEDSNINGHPVNREFGPGPMEAIEAFMAENHDFEVDRECEKFLITFNPNGYLRKRFR